MARIESFPIDEDIVHQFIKKYNKKVTKKSDKYIFINFSMVRMQIPWIMSKIIYALGVSEVTGAGIIAITWRPNQLLAEFLGAFGIEHIALDDIAKKDIGSLFKAMGKTASVAVKGKGESLKALKAFGGNVGKNIYEDILRTSDFSTIRTCRNKTVLKKTFHIMWSAYALEKYNKSHSAIYAVTDDMAYHEGVFIRMFLEHGAKVFACSNVGEHNATYDKQGDVLRHFEYIRNRCHDRYAGLDDEMIMKAEEILKKRFSGNEGRDIDRAAFAGKKVLSREEIIDAYNLDADEKTVVIMAHTFTDAVFNHGDNIFKDYYDWTEKTLLLASKNDKVNWILKPHPSRNVYNESKDSIEDLFEKYKKPHMHILSDDVSAESIRNIADVLVTIAGNAGAEFACFGIPPVVTGNPFYMGYGYDIRPETFEEYSKVIDGIQNIETLNDEQIKIAKTVFAIRNSFVENDIYPYTDDFANSINGLYKEMEGSISKKYFSSNDGTEEYNTRALKLVEEYLDSHGLDETAYYQKGKFRALHPEENSKA